jgi:uncharacterized protein YjdB
MEWIPGLYAHKRRQGYGTAPRTIEHLEIRALLADGIAPHPGPQLTGSPGVALTNVVVATFTITDSTGSPGTKWNAEILWGDGKIDKRVSATAGPNGSFQFLGTHTYAISNTYTITVMIAVPQSHLPNDNIVNTKAVIQAAATLQSIAVAPANPSISLGTTQQFSATGTFSDSSTQKLTSQVTWASASPTVATISSASGSQGLATALAVGTSSVSATLSGISGSTVLTVRPSSLISIAITPADPSITKGSTQQFTATGTFSDSSTQNVTSQVTWASANASAATISNASGTDGVATAVATGTSAISATLNGVSTSTTLTVTPAALQSIALAPANPSLTRGATQQFTATGIRTDGSTQNLTNQVTWASANIAVATISSTGLATAVANGTSSITATLNGLTGSTALTVSPLVVAGVEFLAKLKKTFNQAVAYFNEPNTKTQDFHAFIDWGDGSLPSRGHIHGRGNGRFSVIGSHRYVKSAIFPITVTIRDPAGRKASATSLVHVTHK